MPPAARVGDPTAHGVPLAPPGDPTVLIGGMPAYRVGDPPVTCPMLSGQVPHGAESVPMGSSTVLIGGQPAARMGDPLVGAGPPNAIVFGEPTVIIG